jgi:DNA helicase-2/ATP-dependent DNA helicase PcrA
MPDVTALGRSAVVGPGQDPPPEWAGCERVEVGAIDAGAAAELHSAWRERRSLVVELRPGIGLDDPATPPPERIDGLQPWEWSVGLDLPGERLHHAVWANSVDARRPGTAHWRWSEVASALGAWPAGGGPGDVALGDGRPAVCDGGPLDAGLAARLGVAVVHRINLEHGSLHPLTASEPVGTVLAPDQLAAVSEARGGARIIAPAGSGKTRVLTDRARVLFGGWGIPPAAVALVAYNVRAAGEMRDRLEDVAGLRIRTLNALGLRLSGRPTTIDETEVRRILSGLVAFPRRAEADPAAPWIEALSRVRLGLAAPDAVEEELGDVSDLDRVARSYRRELASREAVDFDEQVAAAIEHLLADPAFRARSQRFARVLLVDEFQDLTPAHMLLIRLLSGPAGSVYAVGDDDQTIYGYAGATPRWLVDFERWFPGSATHSLEVNYRCPPAVVGAAANLLSRNAVRVDKVIRPAGGPPGDAAPARSGPSALTVVVADGDAGPGRRTAERVEALLGGGAAPVDIAVLSRVNASLVPVRVLLGHRDVPVDSSGDRRFLQRGGVRGALAWLEVAAAAEGNLPGAALREAARRPKRGMSNGLLDLIARRRTGDSLDGLAMWLESKGSAREAEKVEQLAGDVELVRKAAGRGTAQVLDVVRHRVGGTGLDGSAAALDRWSHGAIAAHMDDLEALAELASLEPDPGRFPGWLAERLAVAGDPAGVTLASIHAVKGREWPHVVVHHATDGLLPHRLSLDLEEERRIFHVGLTRASESATVVAGAPPSPFITEMATAGRPVPTPPPPPPAAGARPKCGSAPAGPATAVRGPVPELLPARPGVVFTVGGHEHEVVETTERGVVALVGGGPARMVIPYGRVVEAGTAPRLLAHPAAAEAWVRLKDWRSAKARELGLPPYVVFDDQTLRAVAAGLPGDEAGLLALRGIGPAKLDSYGSDLMAITEEMRASVG